MFEYVFFNEALNGRFLAMLDEASVARTSKKVGEGFSVFVSEDRQRHHGAPGNRL